MTWFRTLFLVGGTALGLSTASLAVASAEAPLDTVLAHLDQAAVNFKGLTADIRKVSHTEVVNVDDVYTGTIMVKRIKLHDTRIRIDFTSPRRQIVTIGGGKAYSFEPKTNEAQEFDLGKYKGVVDQFMLLGFGSNSGEIKSAYTVTLGGADSINGEKTTRIMLVPKDKEILAQVKKCEVWISDKGWTVQQKFYQSGGDYVLSTYSAMKWNPIIADKDLKLELPKGLKFGKLK
jgi:outer membrane lipoprotein-sorting protein